MAVTVVPMYDATHGGIASLPAGQAAGYATGGGDVPWTDADWAAHPGAVRIAQSPFEPADDLVHADVLDVEGGAATPDQAPGWYRGALAAYTAAVRPGQRYPAIYCDLSNLHAVANALVAAGITAGPKLWLAEWDLSEAAAAALVTGAGGPWPVIGVQYSNQGGGGAYDISVMSAQWLAAVSGPAPPPPPPVIPPVTVTWTLPVLAQGSSGELVRDVQGLAGARGHPVVIDGQFGPATAAAVRAVQAGAKLAQDGVVGPATWPALAALAGV